MDSRGRTWRHLAVGLVIAAAALFLAYRKTDPSELLTALGGISWPLLLIVLPLLAVSYLCRILQWRVLLSPIADVSMGDASGPLLTGFMLNSLLPGRVGELARALLLSRRTNVPRASSFATVVLARLLDGLTLAGMTLVVLMVLQSRLDDTIRMGLIAAGAMYAVVLVVLVALRRWKERAAAVIAAPFGWLGMKPVGLRVKRLLISFSLGLEVMNSWRRLFLAVLYSILIWGSLALSVVPVFAAMHLEILWYYPLLVLILAGLGMLIPTPAGTGTVHGALVLVMPGLIGIPVEVVRVFALLFHSSQFLPIILVGLFAALREGVTPSYIGRLSGDGIEEPSDP
jgi:uncharacterized protein (TIRG00374 family)